MSDRDMGEKWGKEWHRLISREFLVAAGQRALPFVLIGAAFGLFWYASSYRTEIGWNVVDFAIGRNLLRGEGFVDFLGAPPSLWRPPLTPILAGVSQLVFDDAMFTLRLIYAASLTSATWFVFLTARRMMGGGVGLLAAALTATSPALLVTLTTAFHITDAVLLGVMAPAMYYVLVAGETRSLRFYAYSGLLLGLAFMANAAGPLYLAAAALWLLFARPRSGGAGDTAEAGWWQSRRRAVSGIALVVVLFAAVSAPYVTYLSVQKGEFTVNGQGIYTFYSAEGWVYYFEGDSWELGYEQAVEKYGTPGENGYSIVRAILSNPSAFRGRVEQNLDLFTKRFSSKELFPMALIPFVLIGLILPRRRARQGVLLVALFGVPIFAYLAHQTDPRYLVHAVPSAAILAAIGIGQVLTAVRRYTGNPWTVAAVVAIPLAGVAFLWADGTVDYWQRSSRTATDPAQRIAQALRSDLGVSTDVAIKDITECCFFGPALAYYADTRYSWNSSNDPAASPRATVFSQPNFPEVDYLVVSYKEAARHTFSSEPLLIYRDPEVGPVFVYEGQADIERSLLAGIQDSAPNPADVRTEVFEIGDEVKPVLFMADPFPPRSASLTLTVAVDRPLAFEGDVATSPDTWSLAGDGVRFRVLVVDGSGEEREGYDRWIDGKKNADDRRWHHFSVDLSPYVGQTVELVLVVESGDAPDFDHAGWADMRLIPLESR